MKFLLILFFIWFSIYLLFKYIIPWLLTRYVRKMSERMNNMQDNSRQRVRQEEGKVNIEYIPEKDKEKAQSECNSGEYVDFEEID